MMGFRAMNEESVYQADAEDIPSEVSDEALETAAGNEALPAWTNICTGSAARVEQPIAWLSPVLLLTAYRERGRRIRRPAC